MSATSIWRTADQRLDAFRDARAALQLMSNDLSRAAVSGNSQLLNLANPSGTYAKEAYAVAPMKNTGKSDLCAVGYYLDWNSTSHTYSLTRMFKNSDQTVGSLAKSSVDTGTLYDRTQPNTALDTLASYVWDLELRPGQGANLVDPASPPSTWQWIEIRFKAMSVKAGQKLAVIPGINQSTWDDPSSTAYKTYILPNEQQFMTRVPLLQNQ